MLKYTGPKAIMTAKGTHNPAISYEALDIVYDSSSGNSYVAKIDVPPNVPLSNTTYWNISANPNQAVASLQTDVAQLKVDMEEAKTDIDGKIDVTNIIETKEELENVTDLGKVVDATVVKEIAGSKDAKDIHYNNLESGMTASNVQDAVDELSSTKANKEDVEALSETIADAENRGFHSKNICAYNMLQLKELNPSVNYVWGDTTLTYGGITLNFNADGSISANGTASQDVFVILVNYKASSLQNMRLVGCPSGGSSSKYYIYTQNLTSTENTHMDFGSGNSFVNGNNEKIGLGIRLGTNVNGLVFKPMLVNADLYPDVTYNDYVKGYPSNETLFDEVSILKKKEKYTITDTTKFPTPLEFTRKGNNVYIKAGSSAQLSCTAKTWTTIGTIPSELRPPIDFAIPLTNYNGTCLGAIWVYANGTVQVWTPTVSNNYYNTVVMYMV